MAVDKFVKKLCNFLLHVVIFFVFIILIGMEINEVILKEFFSRGNRVLNTELFICVFD
jgi:hypothetical protein